MQRNNSTIMREAVWLALQNENVLYQY